MKRLVIFFCLVSSLAAAQGSSRVEPAFWWVGMSDPSLQLLVHHPNIGQATPRLRYPGVKLSNVKTVTSPNYLFLDLVISPQTKAGKFVIEFVRNSKVVFEYSYELKTRVKGSAQRKGFTPADVLYLITPDRFANGDPSNDNTDNTLEKFNRSHRDGRHGGDIRGITQHLDYIKDMGFTTIWPMPLAENNQPEVSYHGYAITDFYKIDPRYGSNEEFVNLAEQAHQKGLKLIIDVVLNHCGHYHWWLKDPPTPDWFNAGGKYSPTNHKRETHQDPHSSKLDARNHADGWFVPTMPDMNQRNPLMAQYLIQNTLWWMEYANLDGIRIDTYPYSDKTFLTDWSKRLLKEYPNLNMVGEEWSLRPSIVSYWQKGKKNHDGYVSYLPSLFDFPLQHNAVEALNEDDRQYNKGLTKIYQTLAEDFLYADAHNLVVMPDNHDMSRLMTQVNDNVELFKMGLTFFATTRGIPQIYYGTEIGMNNPNTDAHGDIRADMPGGWPNDKQSVFAQRNLSPQQTALMDFCKKLFNWRKTASAIHSGKLTHFAPDNGIYVYFRTNAQQTVMVVLNKNKEAQRIDLSKYAEVLQGSSQLSNPLTNESSASSGTLSVAGLSASIWEVK